MKTYETAAEAQLKADSLNGTYGYEFYVVIQDPKTARYRVTLRK